MRDHGTSPCTQELAARRAATLFIIEQRLSHTRNTWNIHPLAIIDGDHGDHPVMRVSYQNDDVSTANSMRTLRRVESVGIGVTSSMRPMRMPDRARARRAL